MLAAIGSLINGLIMDSGTYTLNSNPVKYAKSITVRWLYMAYLKQFADKLDFYFNYDSRTSAKMASIRTSVIRWTWSLRG